jgi:dihydroorotase
VDLISAAKAEGLPVTAEVCPHHLVLSDSKIAESYDPLYKVAPPLRPESDILALRDALCDGRIDCVATDHAPHPIEDKEHEFDRAPCGMLNLETAASIIHQTLVAGDKMDWSRFAEVMSIAPARIRGLEDHGSLREGAVANIAVFDPSLTWTVDPTRLASKSSNTPFAGWTMQGKVRHTIYQGRFTLKDGEDI